MTRAQRRIRLQKERAVSAGLTTAYRDPFAAGMALAANPNRGKRHTAPATAREHSLTLAEREAIKSARRDYRPLTVRTRLDFGVTGRKLAKRYHTESAYTV